VKEAVAAEVAQRSGLSKLTSDFVILVAGCGRTDHIDAIAEKYRRLLDEDLGRVRAYVRTAVPLTDEERRMLSTKIGQIRPSRHALFEEILDPTMLGGVLVRAAVSSWTEASRASSSGCAGILRRTLRHLSPLSGNNWGPALTFGPI
jgi:F0F1-type ATP synthase delta subunit